MTQSIRWTLYFFRREWRFLLLLLVTLAVTVTSMLLLLTALENTIQDSSALAKAERVWNLNLLPIPQPSQRNQKLDEVLFHQSFGTVTSVSDLSLSSQATIDLSPETSTSFQAVAILDNTRSAILTVDSEPATPELVQGRWFSQEEREHGAAVVVLGENSSLGKVYPPDSTMFLGGESLRVVGLCRGTDLYAPYALALHSSVLALNVSTVTFPHPLSHSDRQAWVSLLVSLDAAPQCQADAFSQMDMNKLLTDFILCILLLSCCLLVSHELFGELLRRRSYEFIIYRICGIPPGMLRVNFWLPIILLIFAGYGVGAILYHAAYPLRAWLHFFQPISPVYVIAATAVYVLSLSILAWFWGRILRCAAVLHRG